MSDIVVEQPAVVEAALNYLVATGEKPATYAYEPPAGEPQRSGVYRTQRVNIVNARVSPPPGGLSLDRNGFELRQHASALSDFSDPAAIERIYYPEAEALLKRWTGAKRVVIFDHTLRDGQAARARGVREPVKFIHNDQTFVSGPRRVRDHLPPHEAAELLKGRVAIVNLHSMIRRRRPMQERGAVSNCARCCSSELALARLSASLIGQRTHSRHAACGREQRQPAKITTIA